jgi:hypothetical protein
MPKKIQKNSEHPRGRIGSETESANGQAVPMELPRYDVAVSPQSEVMWAWEEHTDLTMYRAEREAV